MTATSPPAPSQPDVPWCLVLDGKGNAQQVPVETLSSVAGNGPLIWLHIPAWATASAIMRRENQVPPKVAEAFSKPLEQARLAAAGGGLILTLPGVVLPARAEDVVLPPIQVWIRPDRVVTAASPLPADIREIRSDLMAGAGPGDVGDFLGRLALLRIRDLGPLLDDHSGALDRLEARILTREVDHLGRELNKIRLELLRLHRHLSPTRTLLHDLLQEHGRHSLGTGDSVATLREASERVDDRLERLEGLREHCGALQAALTDLQSQRMNSALYLLSLYTALFLPMGVLTGLLGINVGGIPGAQSPWGFSVVCLFLVLFGVVGYLVFRRIGLIAPVRRKGHTDRRHRRTNATRGEKPPERGQEAEGAGTF